MLRFINMKKTGYILVTAIFMSLICFSVSAAEYRLSSPSFSEVIAVSGGIRLSWTDDKNSDKTIIYRKQTGKKKFRKIATVKKDTYTDKTAQTGTQYVYRLKSYRKASKGKVFSENSQEITAVTYKTEKVNNITATHLSKDNFIRLDWNVTEGADFYQVYRSRRKNGKYKLVGTAEDNFFEDTAVKNNKVYYYKIRGVNSQSGKNVQGAFSSVREAGSKGKVNYNDCRADVYALRKVKIRTSPSVKAQSAGVLKRGYGIVRVSQGDNGWTKVIYENNIRYIKSKYLTEERMTVYNKNTGRIIVNPRQNLWNLVVVNGTREMMSGYEPVLDEIFDTGKSLDYRVTPYYEDMYKAAKKDGVNLRPYSAYRSYEQQENNYNDLVKKYMREEGLSKSFALEEAATVILPLGTSEHNLGLAVDICCTENRFAKTKEYKWLVKNAHKYGFILRYTEEKSDITGVVDEPWHWRFVGTEYAKDIKNSGLCLEEYLEMKGIAF